jgi:hypothetical protein
MHKFIDEPDQPYECKNKFDSKYRMVVLDNLLEIPSQNKEMATVIHESFELEHGLPKVIIEFYIGYIL